MIRIEMPPEDAPSLPRTDAALPPQNFCIVLHHDGRAERFTGCSPGDYLRHIEGAEVGWVHFTITDLNSELEPVASAMGFSLIPFQKLITGFYSAYEDYDTELGIMLPAVGIQETEITVRQIVILLRKNFVLTLHNRDVGRLLRFSRYAQQFLKKLSTTEGPVDKCTLILERIIDENNDRNNEYLRDIEIRGDEISKSLLEETVSRKEVANSIYTMKHILITYLNVLWASKDVIESLRYGDSDLITSDERLLGRIGILSDNIDRQIGLSEQMSGVLASGLEVMQSIYNNQLQSLNNRFALVTAYLTVLGTAFLVPNTIATIAGSGLMEGKMAAQWWYLPLLIGSTIAATLFSFLWVLHVWKRRGD